MIAFVLSLMLFAGQAAPAAPVVTAPPAPPVAEKPPPPSARLETIVAGMKGKPTTAFTAKLGPADSVRQALDGQVLIWSVKVKGATVCGANAAGALVCGRQGDGECMVVVAFSKANASTVWRLTGLPAACEHAADLLEAPAVSLPKLKPEPKPRPGQ